MYDTITAKIVLDSVSPAGVRLTTFQLRYPRFIHAEFMTHRVFSRNARSSRAVPTAKLLEEVRKAPAMPIHWGKNQPGMQANAELEGLDRERVIDQWLSAAKAAVNHAESMLRLGAHKQIVNRILEPFTFIDVLVSSTEWENFFGLRDHPDAQPEIHELAEKMLVEYWTGETGEPSLLHPGQWHLPYINSVWSDDVFDGYRVLDNKNGWERVSEEIAIKCSVARCARVSYKAFDGNHPTIEDDLALYDKLVGAQPMHASPAEHQATPDEPRSAGISNFTIGWWHQKEHGNFRGWRQYRKMLDGEAVAPHHTFDDPGVDLPFVKDGPAVVYTRNT